MQANIPVIGDDENQIELAMMLLESLDIVARCSTMTVPNLTTQHIDFNEWLEQCPVQWFKYSLYNSAFNTAVYEFRFDAAVEEDEE